jgi:hypothetical protein
MSLCPQAALLLSVVSALGNYYISLCFASLEKKCISNLKKLLLEKKIYCYYYIAYNHPVQVCLKLLLLLF